MWYFSYKSVHMEAFKKSRYAGTLATYFRPIFRMAQELLADMFVAKV